jgi:hypothetical protein
MQSNFMRSSMQRCIDCGAQHVDLLRRDSFAASRQCE